MCDLLTWASSDRSTAFLSFVGVYSLRYFAMPLVFPTTNHFIQEHVYHIPHFLLFFQQSPSFSTTTPYSDISHHACFIRSQHYR